MHNSVKSFSKPLNKCAETFIDDVRDALKEICFMLNISCKSPPERISHRWLSLYGCCTTYFELFDTLVILFAPWIPKDMKNTYA